ncbi:MAG TPA: zinc-binding dehydrogenase [Chlamydiales bacterium]|nr:zinc-binding dehydrogenase [Chlamydiales bacterium]
MKTLAAVLVQQNAPLEIHELIIPPLKPGQVLVQIAYSGVCQTQLNEIRGHKGLDPYLPHTMRHEASGTILDVGANVKKVKKGDRVVVSWLKGMGADVPNTIYESSDGRKIQSGAVSTFMEKAVVSENRVIPIPEAMPLKEAALLGCAIPTGAGVIFNEMQIKAGNSIAIFGIGGVGLSAILAARYLGAAPLIAIDVVAEKLEKAKALGATHAIDASAEDVVKAIQQITENQGVDFSLESAGRKDTMELAFHSLKASKSLCVIAGNAPKGQLIQIDPFDLIRGRRIIGTWGGASSIDRDIPHYVSLFQNKSLPLAELISHQVELSKINELMKLLELGKISRGIITF